MIVLKAGMVAIVETVLIVIAIVVQVLSLDLKDPKPQNSPMFSRTDRCTALEARFENGVFQSWRHAMHATQNRPRNNRAFFKFC